MKRTNPGRWAALAAVAAGTLLLSACGGGGADDGSADSGEPRVYIEAISGDPESLNGQLASGATPTMFSSQIFDNLVRITNDYEIHPGLAKSWELAEDGLTLTLELESGVTWHDGEPFTAEDVEFNLEELVELQTFGARLAQRIASVDVVDDDTVVVNFSEPFGPTLETLALQFMLPKHIYEGTDYVTNPANMEPIGTGPMMFESYSSGESVILKKNPDYWGGDVQVDRAVFPVMSDPNSRAVAMMAGELDRASLDPSQQDRIGERENLSSVGGQFPQVITAMFNANSPYLNDATVRGLVFAAIDREAILETALSGLGEVANGFMPPELDWAVNSSIDFDKDFPHDIEAINAGLDEAGFPVGADGSRFTLNVRYISELSEVAATGEMIQSMLEEVGITVNLVGTAAPVFTEKVYTASDFDIALLRSTLGADPSIGIARWYECNPNKNAAANPSGICDPEIDAAAQGALSSTDRAVRAGYFEDMQARANELMFYAPLSWYTGWRPTINSDRWSGQDAPQLSTGMLNWLTMKPVG